MDEEDYADEEEDYVEDEGAVVVYAHAVSKPWAVVVVAGDAAFAASAVFAAEGFSDHAYGAEMLFVECSGVDELFNGCFLLSSGC